MIGPLAPPPSECLWRDRWKLYGETLLQCVKHASRREYRSRDGGGRHGLHHATGSLAQVDECRIVGRADLVPQSRPAAASLQSHLPRGWVPCLEYGFPGRGWLAISSKFVVAGIAGLVVLFAACSGDELGPARAGHTLSFADYERGFLDYQECMTKVGHPLINPRLDSTSFPKPKYEYEVAITEGSDSADEKCYVETFMKVDGEWQQQLYADDPLAAPDVVATLACARRLGVRLPEAVTPIGLQAAFQDAGYDLVLECFVHPGRS